MLASSMPTKPKVQFNVYLPPELVRSVKHRAVDDGVSLSELVQRALLAHLRTAGVEPTSNEIPEVHA